MSRLYGLPYPQESRERIADTYRHAPRTEPCLCGGNVTAGPNDGDVVLAVQRHQRAPGHREWAVRMYGEGEPLRQDIS